MPGYSVIREEDVLPMISAYLNGASPGDLARVYGYKRTTIKELMRRRGCARTQSDAAKLAVKQGKKDIAIVAMIEAARTTNRYNPAKAHRGLAHPKARPLFDTRLHNTGGVVYRQVKIAATGRWKYEHRYVMECILGRKLSSHEVVHHINGNTLDNRPENLLLVTKRQHTTIHDIELPKEHFKNMAQKAASNRSKRAELRNMNFVCERCGTRGRYHAKGLCRRCYMELYREKRKAESFVSAEGGAA